MAAVQNAFKHVMRIVGGGGSDLCRADTQRVIRHAWRATAFGGTALRFTLSGLFAALFVLTWHSSLAAQNACKWNGQSTTADPEDCIERGGRAVCTLATPGRLILRQHLRPSQELFLDTDYAIMLAPISVVLRLGAARAVASGMGCTRVKLAPPSLSHLRRTRIQAAYLSSRTIL